jgi:hypothetical protein
MFKNKTQFISALTDGVFLRVLDKDNNGNTCCGGEYVVSQHGYREDFHGFK